MRSPFDVLFGDRRRITYNLIGGISPRTQEMLSSRLSSSIIATIIAIIAALVLLVLRIVRPRVLGVGTLLSDR